MRALIQKLKQQGIKEVELHHFKLYNPDTYEKFIQQAGRSIDIAVKNYRGIILTSNKRV